MTQIRRRPTAEGAFSSYAEVVLDVLSAEPARPVITTAEGLVISAGEFRDQVHRLAGELAGRGVGRGTTVTLLTGNTAEALVARYAAGLAGGRVVSLYEGMSPSIMARVMASVDCSLLLVDGQRHAIAQELLHIAGVPRMLSLGPSGFAEDVLAVAARRPAQPMSGMVGPEDDWCIRHTGGTTGVPKGIRISHDSYRQTLDHRLAGAATRPAIWPAPRSPTSPESSPTWPSTRAAR